MFWRGLLYQLDQVMWYAQQLSAAVLLGWFSFYLGKRLLERYMK